MFIAENLEICDPVWAFDEIMEEIGIERYLKPEGYRPLGRPGYSRVNMLKTILFSFMDTGYATLRELEDRCKVNLRYMYLMDYETPGYHCFGDFINEELQGTVEEIFRAIMEYIREKEGVDMQHLYIDGSKFEANANICFHHAIGLIKIRCNAPSENGQHQKSLSVFPFGYKDKIQIRLKSRSFDLNIVSAV